MTPMAMMKLVSAFCNNINLGWGAKFYQVGNRLHFFVVAPDSMVTQ
jgi:hypothetical protein